MSPDPATLIDRTLLLLALLLPIYLVVRWNSAYAVLVGALANWALLLIAGVVVAGFVPERRGDAASILDIFWMLFGWIFALVYTACLYLAKHVVIRAGVSWRDVISNRPTPSDQADSTCQLHRDASSGQRGQTHAVPGECRGDAGNESNPTTQYHRWPTLSMIVLAAAIVTLGGLAAVVGEPGVWLVSSLVVPIPAACMWKHPSPAIRLLTPLMLLQFVGAGLLQPGDGGMWFGTICRLYLALDVFLFVRLYLFYKLTHRPEPKLSWATKIAILTSPITIGWAATYLMDNHGIFRG